MLSLAYIGSEEHQAVFMATYTNDYLNEPDVLDMAQNCIDSLLHGGQRMGMHLQKF